MTSSPSKVTVPVLRPHDPEDRLQRRRLPGRVAAEQRDELAGADLDLDVLEDVDQAVEGVDPGEPEQRLGVVSCSLTSAPPPWFRDTPRPRAGSVATCVERALRDLDPVVERDDPVRDSFDDVHVVLDHEDRVAAFGAELRDQLGDLVRLDRIHPGGRLVEEEQPRVGRGGARDLEPPPVRVREAVRRLVPAVAHQPIAEEREPRLGELADLALLTALAGRAEHRPEDAGPGVPVRRRHHVLAHAHVQEQAQRLEGARDPALGDLVRLEADDAAPFEEDVACGRLVDAGDEVEERRLAGAVRADHADDLSLAHVDVEPVDDREAAERHRDVAQLEQACGRGAHTISTRFSPNSPSGRAIMAAIRIAPRTTKRVGSGLASMTFSQTNAAEVERRHEQHEPQPGRAPRVSVSTAATRPM